MPDTMGSVPLVLVADDEPQMRDIVASHLRSLADPKLDVVEAADGEQAWKLACEKLPDLVVLDVRMPEMSGWEVCKKIRESVALTHTGVIMLTGIGERLNEITSPLYGADAYIDKPFEFNELDRKVKDVLDARAPQREAVPRPRENGVHAPARPAKAATRSRSDKADPPSHAKPSSMGKGKGKSKSKTAAASPATKKAAAKKSPAKKAAPKSAVGKKAPVKKAPVKASRAAAPKRAAVPARAAKRAPAKKASPKKRKK
jgi:DNA-binding response OmpR family regulator